MSLDREQNQMIEIGIFGTAIVLTLFSVKVNVEKWLGDREEEEARQKMNLKMALDPDSAWREQVKKQEELEGKGFARESQAALAAKNKRRVRGSRRQGAGKSAMDEVMTLDDDP
mmetsp:Transcript_82134/g.255027  ORF Transcript_82134/g.255027 Transcript_82134/m.255027 type:complete len:114 (+) Transcript_82134:341-682(+)